MGSCSCIKPWRAGRLRKTEQVAHFVDSTKQQLWQRGRVGSMQICTGEVSPPCFSLALRPGVEEAAQRLIVNTPPTSTLPFFLHTRVSTIDAEPVGLNHKSRLPRPVWGPTEPGCLGRGRWESPLLCQLFVFFLIGLRLGSRDLKGRNAIVSGLLCLLQPETQESGP